MQLLGLRFKKRRRTWADLLPVGVALGLLFLVGPRIAQGIQAAAPLPPGLLHAQPDVTAGALVGRPWRVDTGDQLMFGVLAVRLAGVVAPAAGTRQAGQAQAALELLTHDVELHCTLYGVATPDHLTPARCIDPWGRDIAAELARTGYVTPIPTTPTGAPHL